MFFFNGSLYSMMKVDVNFSKVHVISEDWEQIIPFSVCLRGSGVAFFTCYKDALTRSFLMPYFFL